jgi:DNA-binding transcriptional regulator LsrR (DeoR family)
MNCALIGAIRPLSLFVLAALPMPGAAVPGVRQIFDKQLSATERDVMELVEAMPPEKFNFVPTQGAFKHARNFGVQARHIAFCLNEVAVALLGEPMLPHTDQGGPKNLTSRDEIVRHLKDAFAHAHRAIDTLTNENLLEQIADPYNEKFRTTRLEAVGIFFSHTYDHYGQMVEYLRMNNVVLPGHQ